MWIRILGIDPGLRHVGWGVIESEGTKLRYVASGTFDPRPDLAMHLRLAEINESVSSLLIDQDPMEVAMEQTFVNANAKATLALGQARGAAMAAVGVSGRLLAEYAPNQIKKTVVGVGHADKEQIRAMVNVLLPLARPKTPDESDALAIALCHAQHRQIFIGRPDIDPSLVARRSYKKRLAR